MARRRLRRPSTAGALFSDGGLLVPGPEDAGVGVAVASLDNEPVRLTARAVTPSVTARCRLRRMRVLRVGATKPLRVGRHDAPRCPRAGNGPMRPRSEERRVGKEGRARGGTAQ